jgi:hypothetical protein
MTNLTHEDRADLRTRIQQGLDIAMDKEDEAFWQAMLLAVEDSAACDEAEAKLARWKAQKKVNDKAMELTCDGLQKQRDTALARVKELEDGLTALQASAHVVTERDEAANVVRMHKMVDAGLIDALLAEGGDR